MTSLPFGDVFCLQHLRLASPAFGDVFVFFGWRHLSLWQPVSVGELSTFLGEVSVFGDVFVFFGCVSVFGDLVVFIGCVSDCSGDLVVFIGCVSDCSGDLVVFIGCVSDCSGTISFGDSFSGCSDDRDCDWFGGFASKRCSESSMALYFTSPPAVLLTTIQSSLKMQDKN